jgi:hypothetical protein
MSCDFKDWTPHLLAVCNLGANCMGLDKIKVNAFLIIYEGLDRGLFVWRSHLL